MPRPPNWRHNRAGQVQWDVIGGFGGPLYADLHNQGLLMTIDHAALGSAEAGLVEGAIEPYGLGSPQRRRGTRASSAAFTDTVPTVADFFDTAGFPGRRGMTAGGFEDWTRPALALVADGVPLRIRPDTARLWERAFTVMDPIKSDVVWFHGGTEMMTSHGREAGRLCLCSDARMIQAQMVEPDAALIRWRTPLDGFRGHSSIAASGGRAAKEFLRYTLDPQRQANFTQKIGYLRCGSASYDLLPADLKSQVAVNPDNLALTFAFTPDQNAWLAEHATEASEQYATWTGQ